MSHVAEGSWLVFGSLLRWAAISTRSFRVKQSSV